MYNYLPFFFFLLPECLWWLLEVSRNPRPKRASWDTYPESLLHPGGSFQLHWTAFQQRPHGPRGRYKTEQAEPRGRARTSSRAVGFCCSFSSWPPQLKGRDFGSVVGAALSLLKGRQDPSFLVPGAVPKPLFWRQPWGFQHQPGDFLPCAAC